MKMTGAQMTVEALSREGVRHVFGIPGGSVIPLYDALYDAPFEHILVRHEQAAAHAADGYARATGKPGVCICTSGPGFTNIVTGLATALSDSVPMVAITGQVATHLLGTDAFQETDVLGGSLPVVKHSYLVRSLEELPLAIKQAFELAVSGRPGPVLVEIPVDIQKQSGEFSYPVEPVLMEMHRSPDEDLVQMDKALALLQKAERPVLLAGGGITTSGASWELLSLAEKIQIPVANTLLGKGVFPDEHPLSLGMAGMHGKPQANMAISHADVILAVGTRFSDRTTGRLENFADKATIIHVDSDASEVDKIISCHVALVADAAKVLDFLSNALPQVTERPWLNEIEEWRKKYLIGGEAENLLTPFSLLGIIQKFSPPAIPVATDVGQNQMWSALHWNTSKPRTFFTSGGLGTMGYGLPSAMGASLALGSAPVLCFAGDGGFLMNLQELETCSRCSIPVKVFILNNESLGMVRQWQELFWDKRYSSTVNRLACSFEGLAKAFGIPGYTCSTPQELESVMPKVFAESGPVLVDCRVAQEEKVFPMVPAGAALRDFLIN